MRISMGGTKNWASTPATQRKPDAPMTNVEFRRLCAKLKINDNATAAELLGPSWRTCQRYWYDEIAAPPPLARLLRLAARLNLSHEQLRKLSSPAIHEYTRLKPKIEL
jgi:hypothetical protein